MDILSSGCEFVIIHMINDGLHEDVLLFRVPETVILFYHAVDSRGESDHRRFVSFSIDNFTGDSFETF